MLKVPADRIAALIKIRLLSASAVDDLVHALEAAAIAPKSEQMATAIAASVTGISSEDLIDILSTIYSLCYVREAADSHSPRFLDDLIEGIKATGRKELSLDAGEATRFREILNRLLSVKTIGVAVKAASLQHEAERLFCDVKILSDIRPVFGTEASSGPIAAVITHTMKIGYHENGDHQEFFVALDDEDLQALREAVDKAQKKESSLHALLGNANLPDLGV